MTKAELEKRIAVLENENALLRRRSEFATTELAEISQGVASTPSWYNSCKNGWTDVIKWRAAKAVEKIAGMRYP